MNIINVVPFDELVSLINNLSDEKSKRILLSKAAEVYGNGGKAHIVELTGITYPTLIAGKADSENDEVISSSRIRREGAGRKSATETYPKKLQYIMGHSDIGVTLNTYTHLQFEDLGEEMEKVCEG